MPGFHHFGRIVTDVEQSLHFYVDLLGMSVLADEELAGPELEAQVEVPGAVMRTAMLRSGSEGPMLELIQYREPRSAPRRDDARPNDLGTDHPCFDVADVHATYEALSASGVRFSCPPQYVDSGYFEGDWVTFCFDPDGLTVELWQSATR